MTATANSGTTQSRVYTADKDLIAQTDAATGTTVYLGDTELPATPAGAIIGTRTYTANGTRIAERDTTATGANNLYWLIPDQNGTANTEVDAATNQVTTRYTDPYGNQLGSSNPWLSSHAFLNAPSNPLTALDHLGARDYDPTLGRFTTIDPVLNTDDPSGVAGYAYSDNDPVNRSDPGGLCPVGACGVGVVNQGKKAARHSPVEPGNTIRGWCEQSSADSPGYWNGDGRAAQGVYYRDYNPNSNHARKIHRPIGGPKYDPRYIDGSSTTIFRQLKQHWRGALQTVAFVGCVAASAELCPRFTATTYAITDFAGRGTSWRGFAIDGPDLDQLVNTQLADGSPHCSPHEGC